MNEQNEQTLDDLLGRHLSDELNGQLGRSASRFAAHLAEESAASERNLSRPSRSWWEMGWAAGIGAASAVAAIAAVLVLVFNTINVVKPEAKSPIAQKIADPQTRPSDVDASTDPTMQRTVFWRTVDEGTVYLDDNTPARQLRRQQVEQVSWIDRAGNRNVTETVPKEDVMLVGYNKY